MASKEVDVERSPEGTQLNEDSGVETMEVDSEVNSPVAEHEVDSPNNAEENPPDENYDSHEPSEPTESMKGIFSVSVDYRHAKLPYICEIYFLLLSRHQTLSRKKLIF